MTALRLLEPVDLDGALTLSSTAGWNQQREDWAMLLSIAPRGSFAAVEGGRIVGTAIGIDYSGFGWIAMMLVDPAYRSRGLGRALLEAAVAAIPSDREVRLDATPMGRRLYESYGFREETALTRYVADPATRRLPPAEASDGVKALVARDLDRVADRDRAVFGGNRRAVLAWALGRAPRATHVVDDPPAGIQYCFGRQGRLFDQIGPIVADSDAGARHLVQAAAAAFEGRPIVIDAFDDRREFGAWLRECGFRAERPLFRMSRAAAADGPSGTARGSLKRDGPRAAAEFAIFGPEFA